MVEPLRFDDKVVIVTGAGNGLGRAHALDFARRGARVLVNDLGVDAGGSGASLSAADQVVAQIKAGGGEAVPNYDSVEDGDKIVQAALDYFGTVDVVVNNAGILRDVSFHKMTLEQWDLILRVHLSGTFRVTRAAWPILRAKGYGRIILTASGAGLYGNFGQANYSAAKLGLYGLANTLAVEGRSKGIHVNTIAPIAASRLTQNALPPELMDAIKPEYVTPLVSWLCHARCAETGALFEVGGGYVAKLRWERSRGCTFNVKRPLGAEEMESKWNKVIDFDAAEHPSSINDTFGVLLKAINSRSLGGNELIDLDVASTAQRDVPSAYNERDVALYALGVGAARNPLDEDELRFVYEGRPQFTVLPTFAVMPATNAMLALIKAGKPLLDGLNYGLERVLHGEQYTEIRAPLATNAQVINRFKLKAAYDKEPHAVVVVSVTTTDQNGDELAYNEITAFVRGAGGWGGDRGASAEDCAPPAREPDAVVEEKTDPGQALLYRLSGDWNPMHADPAFARAFGFERPILQGLCTYGYVGRHVIKAFCRHDPGLFKSIRVRFVDSVFPGETLITRMWKETARRIVLEVRVKERDKLVIRNAAVELFEEPPRRKAPAAPHSESPQVAASAGPVAADIFAAIADFLAANSDIGAQVQTVFQILLREPAAEWVLDLKSGQGEVLQGVAPSPDATLELAESDWIALCTGAADANQLFITGKLHVAGNIKAAQKLGFLRRVDRKLVEAAVQRRIGPGNNPFGSGARS
jgi:(3R)-3-hydroxyacyl-CoA dehydrogenase / 3a,7a,12a-trihydroxy-5b-cholest-24-enoyl-CoA hydratase / enoyl-CoA hydratase 2